MKIDLIDASAPLRANFSYKDNDWYLTPYQTAHAQHNAKRAAKLVTEYFAFGDEIKTVKVQQHRQEEDQMNEANMSSKELAYATLLRRVKPSQNKQQMAAWCELVDMIGYDYVQPSSRESFDKTANRDV
jgi:hypothetical protein